MPHGYTCKRLPRAACAWVMLLLAASLPAFSQDASLESAIAGIQSSNEDERSQAARDLIANWEDALPKLIKALEGFDTVTAETPFTEEQINALLPITDVLRAILLNVDGSIHPFRLADTHSAIRALVWGARGENKSLRINSTYVLASVIDNTSLCVVLHHLRDPTLNPSARVNLLQVAISMAAYAYDENARDAMETKKIVMQYISDSDTQSKRLLETLDKRVNSSRNLSTPLPYRPCQNYDYNAPLDPRPEPGKQ